MSESTLVLPQQTYATVALEYTLVKGQVQSCTLAGLTKPMYQLSVITLGLTGLGGGCTGTNGKASAAGSGQPMEMSGTLFIRAARTWSRSVWVFISAPASACKADN